MFGRTRAPDGFAAQSTARVHKGQSSSAGSRNQTVPVTVAPVFPGSAEADALASLQKGQTQKGQTAATNEAIEAASVQTMLKLAGYWPDEAKDYIIAIDRYGKIFNEQAAWNCSSAASSSGVHLPSIALHRTPPRLARAPSSRQRPNLQPRPPSLREAAGIGEQVEPCGLEWREHPQAAAVTRLLITLRRPRPRPRRVPQRLPHHRTERSVREDPTSNCQSLAQV